MSGRALLHLLANRRSVAPRRLRAPGPAPDELESVLRVGLRAPDHAGLVPWRVVEFPTALRGRLAELFVAEKLRRVPTADAEALVRTRGQALDPPGLLGFVVRVDPDAPVPPHEQWLAAGAALGNLLNAFHALGYGASMLSGPRCDDAEVARALGVAQHERLAGFVSVGTVDRPPAPATDRAIERVWSVWAG